MRFYIFFWDYEWYFSRDDARSGESDGWVPGDDGVLRLLADASWGVRIAGVVALQPAPDEAAC